MSNGFEVRNDARGEKLIIRQTTVVENTSVLAMRNEDKYLEILDAALTAAENHLQGLLSEFTDVEIELAFTEHIQTHLTSELANIREHGHRNDDPEDIPCDR